MRQQPAYQLGDLLVSRMHEHYTYIIVDYYWTGGMYTYELFVPSNPHEPCFRTELDLQRRYVVQA